MNSYFKAIFTGLFSLVSSCVFCQVQDSLIIELPIISDEFLTYETFGQYGSVFFGNQMGMEASEKGSYIRSSNKPTTSFEIYHVDKDCRAVTHKSIQLDGAFYFLSETKHDEELLFLLHSVKKDIGYLAIYNVISQAVTIKQYEVEEFMSHQSFDLVGDFLYIEMGGGLEVVDFSAKKPKRTVLVLPSLFGKKQFFYAGGILAIPGCDTVYTMAAYCDNADDSVAMLFVAGVCKGKLVIQIKANNIDPKPIFQQYNKVFISDKEVDFYWISDDIRNPSVLRIKRMHIEKTGQVEIKIIDWNTMSFLPEATLWKTNIKYELIDYPFSVSRSQERFSFFEASFLSDSTILKTKSVFPGINYQCWNKGKLGIDSVFYPFTNQPRFASIYDLDYAFDTTNFSGSLVCDNGEVLKCFSVSPTGQIELKYSCRLGMHRSPSDKLRAVDKELYSVNSVPSPNLVILNTRTMWYTSVDQFTAFSLRKEKVDGPLVLRIYHFKS